MLGSSVSTPDSGRKPRTKLRNAKLVRRKDNGSATAEESGSASEAAVAADSAGAVAVGDGAVVDSPTSAAQIGCTTSQEAGEVSQDSVSDAASKFSLDAMQERLDKVEMMLQYQQQELQLTRGFYEEKLVDIR